MLKWRQTKHLHPSSEWHSSSGGSGPENLSGYKRVLNALHNQSGELNVGDKITVNLIGDKQPPIS